MIKNIVIPFACFSLLLTTGCGPRSYEDCIIDAMSGVGSDFAAKSIRMSCRDKFPDNADEQSADVMQLQQSEINRISGSLAKAGVGNSISMNTYNGNQCVTVKSLVVSVSNSTGTKKYKIDSSIPPLSIEQVFFDIAMTGSNDTGYPAIVSGTGVRQSGDCDELPNQPIKHNADDDFFNQDFSKFGQAQ